MASQQARRENKSDEREIDVEKDKVPKMASHFESLTVKDSGDQPVAHHVIATMHGGIHDQSETHNEKMQKKESEYKGPSLEEISKSRGNAQQNSMEAIRAAEDRANERGQMTGQHRSQQTALENAARVSDYTVVKGQQTKETLSSAAQTAAEKAARAKDYTLEKGQQTGQQAKETLSSAAQTAAARAKDYTLEKSAQAKDTTVDVTKKSASYIGETGKATVGYVGKVAGVVKDKAVVTGWTAAEYASEKAVGVTETMAKATAGVVGLAGNTVVATKDVLADVGKKTKDAVVSTEESVKDYAARKRAEKQRELEAKNSAPSKGEGEFGDVGNQSMEINKGYSVWGGEEHESAGDFVAEGGGGVVGGGGFELQGGGGGGLMSVIGETLVEIGQNTKDMLVGRGGYVEEQQHQHVGNRDV